MHNHVLDGYSHLDSPLHRIPAALKMAVAVAAVVALVTAPATPVGITLAAAALIVAVAVSNIPPAFMAKRLLLLEPFVLGVAVLSLFQPHGLRIFATLVARTTLCILTMILLSNTTRFSDMLKVLRRLRAPSLMVTTLALMHRYLYVLKDEAQRMQRARACRTFSPHRRPVRQGIKAVATVIARLFVRSTERAERIYAAMCSRGWQ